MTKVKDLVTVTVGTAFALFPGEDERYELISALAGYVQAAIINGDERFPWGTLKLSIREFLQQTAGNFLLGASSYASVRASLDPNSLPAIVRDRARRVQSSIPDSAPIVGTGWEVETLVPDTVLCLWIELFVRLVNSHRGFRYRVGMGGVFERILTQSPASQQCVPKGREEIQ